MHLMHFMHLMHLMHLMHTHTHTHPCTHQNMDYVVDLDCGFEPGKVAVEKEYRKSSLMCQG